MVVDDDPVVRRLVASTLRDEGYRVSIAADGLEAVALATASPPDAIVLDLEMPGLDGTSVYQELRRREIPAPVLILSANGAHEARRAISAQAALDKPFDPVELLRCLKRLVSPVPGATGVAGSNDAAEPSRPDEPAAAG